MLVHQTSKITMKPLISENRFIISVFMYVHISDLHCKTTDKCTNLEISSLECVRPGINPRFLSQKIAANDPEKNMPSTAANAITRSAKLASSSAIHRRAQSAFFLIQGNSKIAFKRRFLKTNFNKIQKKTYFSSGSRMYVSINLLYISEWIFSIAIWKP